MYADCRLQVHVTWAKNGNGRRLSTSCSGDIDVSFNATELSVRFRLQRVQMLAVCRMHNPNANLILENT
nr:hypothetical protein [Tanacetum cinerariifolium]